jgi:O-antigen ligase
VLGGAALAVLAVALVIPTSRDSVVNQSKKGLDHATSGRWGQVTTGLRIAEHNLLWGVGVGSFKRAYAERTGLKGKEPKKGASHNTPVTMAAETGIPGVLLLGWLLVAALLAAFRRAGPSFEGRIALFAGVSLGAIAVHSLFYNAFFEDPTTWGLLALAAVAAVGAGAEAPTGEEAPVSPPTPSPVPVEAP